MRNSEHTRPGPARINKLDRKNAILSWALYDWANSAFATTVMAGFFPIFFNQFWCVGADTTVSTARLGLANSLAGITVAICAPVLGAISDKGTSKKSFLAFFALMGIMMTCSLYLISEGNWPMAVIVYVLATVGFSGGNVFYDALITVVASEKRMDLVSALGFSLGYLGGGILFAVNVWMTLSPQTFGFAGPKEAIKSSFLMVGFWWAVFTLPILLVVKEPHHDKLRSGSDTVRAGIAQLKKTFQEMRHLKTIILFLAAYWLYMDGVDTIIRMAIDYGISIGLGPRNLLTALLITQFIGFPSAIGFGYLGGKIGDKRTILAAIVVYLFITIHGAFMKTTTEFYVLAVVIGLVQGGIQALSRSFYAKIIPLDKSAEYFGFYNMLGKFAAVIGPVFVGGVGLTAKLIGLGGNAASRISIASISLFFIVGGILFAFVNESRGKEELKNLSQ